MEASPGPRPGAEDVGGSAPVPLAADHTDSVDLFRERTLECGNRRTGGKQLPDIYAPEAARSSRNSDLLSISGLVSLA